ncbi:MAG: hypothetical protein IJ165_03635 [Proteobacteria bacterium]|nr:hypothetical protein [Pseudomonadota bacterium]
MPTMYDEKKFDKRLIDRHLSGGAIEMARITKEELQAHLDALPDLADKCEPVSVVQPIFEKNEDAEAEAGE